MQKTNYVSTRSVDALQADQRLKKKFLICQPKKTNPSLGASSSSMSKVVRRKKSGLVDDHFQATIPSGCSDKKGAPHPPPPPQTGKAPVSMGTVGSIHRF